MPPAAVPLRVAVRAWWSIALQSFGGPAGQIAVMHRELVDERRWISEERFLRALSFCMVLPGPEAQQLAVYLGSLLNGTLGGLIAGSLFILPGCIALLALSATYVQWGSSTAVTALLAGLGPAVLAIVAQAVARIGSRTLRTRALLLIAVAAFLALELARVPFPVVVILAGVLGAVYGRRLGTTGAAHGATDPPTPTIVPDDALHRPRPSIRRTSTILVVGVTVWLTPLALVASLLGSHSVLVEEGLFFSGTALVTFGGAYAVLSFVAQRAVEVHHWLLPGEMLTGLGFAETTPGPLIMVLQFVAFLGAYRNPGTLDPWVAALLGSAVAVWSTFVPSFVLVLLGSPYIERLRAESRLSHALGAISAAVVGVVAHLGVFLTVHTVFDRTRTWRQGPFRAELPVPTSLDGRALAIAVLAAVLLFRVRWSIPRVLAACTVVGAVVHLLSR